MPAINVGEVENDYVIDGLKENDPDTLSEIIHQYKHILYYMR